VNSGRIVVVGAGIVGLACASALVQRGRSVLMLDPLEPGQHCSLGNAGCFSQSSFVPVALPGAWKQVPGWLADPLGPLAIRARHLPRLVPWLWHLHRSTRRERVDQIADALFPLLARAIDQWRSLASWAGVPELVVQRGHAIAYFSERAFLGDALGRELRRARGVRMEVLTGAAVRDFDPALSAEVTHLVVLPEQGHCPNPLRLSQAIAGKLEESGVSFVRDHAVDFTRIGDRITHVVTITDRIEAGQVVIAAGAHSAPLARRLGTRVPLETERGYHVMLEGPTTCPRVPLMSGEGKYYCTPMENGLRIAGTVEFAGLRAAPDYRRADAMLQQARRLLPSLSYRTLGRWMGHRPSLPDSLPVIGRAPKASNVYFAFGHGHVGLTASAATARAIAQLVDGISPSLDLAPFAANRF
jgi:D-amino-acid dehydrogenase